MSFDIILGKKAESDIQLSKHINSISRNPFFQIRYSNVRCLPVNKFPYIIHFLLDEKRKTAYIISILHTSQNPDKWPGKR